MKDREKPQILKTDILAQTRLFVLERLHLRFSNGEEREYERFCTRGHGAVIVAAMPSPDTVLLVQEYAAGIENYELSLPKGVVDAGETILEAANRELMEEVGFGARNFKVLKKFATAPGYWTSQITLVLATDLYPASLPGDEPEELIVVPWRLSELSALSAGEECKDARTLAALYLVRDLIKESA